MEGGAVALLVLLLPGHAEGLGGDLFEVALLGQEKVDGGRGDLLRLRGLLRQLLQQDDLGAAVLAVFLRHGLKLLDDLPADAGGLGDEVR